MGMVVLMMATAVTPLKPTNWHSANAKNGFHFWEHFICIWFSFLRAFRLKQLTMELMSMEVWAVWIASTNSIQRRKLYVFFFQNMKKNIKFSGISYFITFHCLQNMNKFARNSIFKEKKNKFRSVLCSYDSFCCDPIFTSFTTAAWIID